MKSKFSLLKPMKDVLGWWKNHKDHDRYELQEKILREVFECVHPDNNNEDEVKIKIYLLDKFYSTWVPFEMISPLANRICKKKLNFDELVSRGCHSLVSEITKKVEVSGLNSRQNYSFATKYCSFHQPKKYLIFDNHVQNMLVFFKKNHEIFKNEFDSDLINKIPNRYNAQQDSKLRKYEIFHKVMEEFREFYGLNGKSIKDVDKFLWMSRKYKLNYTFSKEGKISVELPT